MSKSYRKSNLEKIQFGIDDTFYIQTKNGLGKGIEDEETCVTCITEFFGSFYIYQITIIRDIEDRFEPLYTLKYEDMQFCETKTVKNKTFDELINFLKKQKLLFYEEECFKFIISFSINYYTPNDIYNGIPFIVKEEVDFEKENLPMHKI